MARSKMKKSTVQLVAIILLSVLAGLSIYTYTSGVESRIRASEQTSPVYIALKQIPIGTALGSAINQGLIELKQFPKASSPSQAITLVNTANANLVAMQTLQPGTIILQNNFGITAANTGALVIPDGQLAVTVSLSDPAHVASFLQPGSEITIFVTGSSNKVQYTDVLISRTQVLAVGSQVMPTANGGSTGNTSPLITVAVSPTQAKRLVHASQTLNLYFGLRTTGVDFGTSPAVTDETLLK